ncbi:Putative aliphatic sulfonates transport permease protein ssuC [uncultured Roseburia sp.]|uniref:ABC transporter permease n=1 Tax=Brotonthovivens ammoniilytica TaxID=2981725 RepID=A0ABT2TFX6_9FIRM|nr:ABC transporter permease [Brotonthovivens ammoniilytica]MCU6761052.1 ABC transporter permease [Brotonthovivens ammoniilytica]SCI17437.1 Putative aliphatic sulfonates transport permease protein ssuC [uncultured Roseburia sp.]
MSQSLSNQEQYLKQQLRHKRVITWMRILIFVSFFALWELAADLGWIDDFIFSSPSRMVKCFISMIADKTLFGHLGITLLETLVSFGLVVAFTLIITILLWMNESVSKIVEPYMVILNSLPKSALAPLLIVWLGGNYKTIIVTGMSVAIFGSILSLYTNFMEVNPNKIMLIKTLGGTRRDILFKVLLPANIPALLSIMKVDIGLCLVGVIIGEFIASRQGLGYLIIYGSQVFKLDWVLMSIVILCIIAMILYWIINRIDKQYLKKL